MKRLNLRLSAALFVTGMLLVAPSLASAETDVPSSGEIAGILASRPILHQKIGLADAVRIALKESPVARGAEDEAKVADAALKAARAERLPWVSLNGYLSDGNQSGLLSGPDSVEPKMTILAPSDRFTSANAGLMLPIYTGGRLEAMVQKAKALKNASADDVRAMRLEIAQMTREAYWQVLARESLVEAYRDSLKESQERQRIDQAAYDQEKIPKYYLLRDQAETAKADQMLTNAMRDREASLYQLKTVMGVRLDSKIELTDALEYAPSGPLLQALTEDAALSPPSDSEDASGTDPALNPLLLAAEKNQPALFAAAERAKAGAAEERAAKSAFLPQIGLTAMGMTMKPNGQPSMGGALFGITASIPLFDGGSRQAKLQEARAMRRKADEDREKSALEAARDVASALLDLRAAEKNVRTSETAVAAADEDYRVASLRYQSGKGINVEVLDAQSALVRAQSDRIQALYDYVVSEDRLALAVGSSNLTGG
jgi:outer membrane protein TolC